MNKNLGKKIGIIGNQSTTVDLIRTLTDLGYKISCVITMPSDRKGTISGYVDIMPIARKLKIPLVHATHFTLMHKDDMESIGKYNLDVLLVFGWQRLIPPWLLSSLPNGAFGSHGSWKNLPYGRGRSLLNWSLILGKDRLIDNLFRYDTGADSGDIIESFQFEITPLDTIASLHHKDQLVHQELLIKHLPKILEGKVKYKPQSREEKEVFFPKRTPEEGVIDWSWKTTDLYNLIRALGKPYPGAFTWYKSQKVMVWQAIPFQVYPRFKGKKPGTIISSFSDNTFVVKTKDGALLIEEYEGGKWKPSVDSMLTSYHNKTYDLLRKEKIAW